MENPTEKKPQRSRLSETDKLVGSRIKLRRARLGLSQEKVAGAINTHRQTLAHIEEGRQVASAGQLKALAETLKCGVYYFYGDDGDAEETQ